MPHSKLLILDLDETLIHSSESRLAYPEDFRVYEYFEYKRPLLDSFLTTMAQHFTLAVWSSADDGYVQEAIKNIAPTILFAFVWGRSKCTTKRDLVYETFYFEKRLKKLKPLGHNLEKIIIVDDSPEKARDNYGNAIYIKPFEGETTDNELPHLEKYLLSIKEAENIRTIEKRGWRNKGADI